MNKKIIAIIFVIILVVFKIISNYDFYKDIISNIGVYFAVGEENLVSRNGFLKTEGTALKNQLGKEIVLKGVSSHGIQWFGHNINYDTMKHLRDSWGINVFRVAMYTLENGYIINPKIKEKVINVVDDAIKLDMYVVIDWHILSDGNPNIYKNESLVFFDEMSKLYKDVPNVIYEICNEPNGGVTWNSDIKPYAEEVIPVIRKNSKKALVIVGTPNWSQDVDVAADNPLEFKNIIYSCHFYAGDHGKELQDKIEYALNKNIPIFVSEWGVSKQNGNEGVFINESNQWLDFLDKRSISWINWSFSDKQESSALLKNYYKSEEYNIDDNLTEAGRYIKSVINTKK